MPNKRISMRKIKEILRLNHHGLSNQQIGRISGICHTTVSNYLAWLDRTSLKWPLPDDLSEADLERRLFPPPKPRKLARKREVPDWEDIHLELRRKGVTLLLLWDEYREQNPEEYEYSWFCRHYRKWAGKLDLVMRQDHKAGEKLFVDYAGMTVSIIDQSTGEVRQAQVFVVALGASGYTYAEATWTQGLEDWIASHQRCFEFIGGVVELVVPDNLLSAVKKAHRYGPDINPTYQDRTWRTTIPWQCSRQG